MLSSLIFAALAAAWLAVLVPIFARRRQEVSRTTDTALAARVVRRGSDRAPASPAAPETDRVEEAYGMPGTDRDDAHDAVEADFDDEYQDDAQWRTVNTDDVRAGRRYRPGRGGFDPEAAALAARTKYARRQRIVLLMLLLVVSTAVLAGIVWAALWSLHAIVDLALIGYLTYLRRQVRIEEEIRSRRLARMSGESADETGEYEDVDEHAEDETDEPKYEPEYEYEREYDVEGVDEFEELEALEDDRRLSPRAHDAVVVDIDDEDPMFDELDERTWEPYRRASGE